MRVLGRLEGKQDAILSGMSEHRKRIDKLEENQHKTDKKFAWFAGAAAVGGVILTKLADAMKIFS